MSSVDLNVIALTDHNVVEGALRARDLWARGNYRFDFIVGEEISTREGHMLALFIEKRIPADLSIERSIDLVHEQGGLAIVAHPLNPLFRHSCQREVLDRIFENDDVWLELLVDARQACHVFKHQLVRRKMRRLQQHGVTAALE